MKGILEKNNGKWEIKYLDWGYETTTHNGILGKYMKRLHEFVVELDLSDAKDADSLSGTKNTLENKEIRFTFKEVGGVRYGKLVSPTYYNDLDEIEQEILTENFKKSKKFQPIETRIVTELGSECIVCESKIELSQMKQICDDCLKALKSLILEKRANSTDKSRRKI